jgi:hypothetical protein
MLEGLCKPLRTLVAVCSATNKFEVTPGSPIAYWATERVKQLFHHNKPLAEEVAFKEGAATGNNEFTLYPDIIESLFNTFSAK